MQRGTLSQLTSLRVKRVALNLNLNGDVYKSFVSGFSATSRAPVIAMELPEKEPAVMFKDCEPSDCWWLSNPVLLAGVKECPSSYLWPECTHRLFRFVYLTQACTHRCLKCTSVSNKLLLLVQINKCVLV